jgi:threonine/homoserine/homoserine lactone efflux protein
MSFIIGLSGALTPGPLLIITINKSLEGGFRKGGCTVFGHFILEAPLILLLCLGLGTFLNQDWLKTAIAIIGGAGLVILGGYTVFSAWKKKIKYPLNTIREKQTKDNSELVNPTNDFEEKNWKQRMLNNSVIMGLTATASNPFYWIWWITIGVAIFQYAPTLAGITTSNAFYWMLGSYAGVFLLSGFDLGYLIIGSVALSWIFLAIGHFSSDLAWYTMVSFMVAKGRVLLNQRKYEIIIAVCGAALVILGAWFLLSPVLG